MPTFAPLGDAAVRVCFGDAIAAETLQAVHGFVRALDQRPVRGLREVVPAYAVAVVYYDPHECGYAAMKAHLEAVAETASVSPRQPRRLVVPICYGGEFGPDLSQVAARHAMSEDEVIARHLAPVYTVAMLGFTPGFPYLAGLDPAIATPRLATPRPLVPAGSVGLAGAQTGIYPLASPGGWPLIGRTPWRLFDPNSETPFRLAPGDEVRFERIDAATFETMRDRECP